MASICKMANSVHQLNARVGVAVIEWSEKFPDRIPADALMITIEKVDMNQRLFTFDFAAHKWQDLEKEVENYAVSH